MSKYNANHWKKGSLSKQQVNQQILKAFQQAFPIGDSAGLEKLHFIV